MSFLGFSIQTPNLRPRERAPLRRQALNKDQRCEVAAPSFGASPRDQCSQAESIPAVPEQFRYSSVKANA